MALRGLPLTIFLVIVVIFTFLSVSAWVTAWRHSMVMEGMMGGIAPIWWMGPTIITIILAVVALTFYILTQNIATGSKAGEGVEAIRGLTEEEARIVRLLKENGGQVLQKEISKSLKISRLKTHRLVASLKKRGVVDVEKWGNTNLVKLVGDADKTSHS